MKLGIYDYVVGLAHANPCGAATTWVVWVNREHVWFRGTAAECRSLTSELSLSSARPVADGSLLLVHQVGPL